ncbi:MAG: hypothetical protein EXR62_17595 [Chloroflexi bacterium]|nr:hypothetical protein [Chloroflexota bacterium]
MTTYARPNSPAKSWQDLNPRLAVPDDLAGVRSELQSRRSRFIHFLAESAGLVEMVQGRLVPSSQAWTWLDAPPAARFLHLWQSWQSGALRQPSLSRLYRLLGPLPSTSPSPPDFQPLLQHLLSSLAAYTPANIIHPAEFAAALAAAQPALWNFTPWWEQEQGRDDAARTLLDAGFQGPFPGGAFCWPTEIQATTSFA